MRKRRGNFHVLIVVPTTSPVSLAGTMGPAMKDAPLPQISFRKIEENEIEEIAGGLDGHAKHYGCRSFVVPSTASRLTNLQ